MTRKAKPARKKKITRSERSLWSSGTVKVTEDDIRTGTDPAKAEEALEQLVLVVRGVRDQETRTIGYARAIQTAARCVGLGIRRRKIAEIISANLPGAHGYARKADKSSGGTGPAARYVALARWELRRWRTGELKVDTKNPVTIGGKEFHSPVMALEANVASFRQVYLAWRAAVTPESARVREIPEKLGEALIQTLEHLRVTIKQADGSLKRVQVTKDVTAIVELARLVLAHPLMEEVMAPAARNKLKHQLEEKALALTAKAS
jgi:hypothetical protein